MGFKRKTENLPKPGSKEKINEELTGPKETSEVAPQRLSSF